MKTAFFDCVFGVSGDMILGALVDCGVPLEELTKELQKLHVPGFELRGETVNHSGIAAIHIDVLVEEQHEHRHLSAITKIIESSDLSSRVKQRALRVFERLAEAEARVHGTTPEKIHFHEVGALDAIVDVVGACIGLEYLGIDTVVSTPLHFGTGTVKCAHGIMPVPVPAVVELTQGVPVVRTGIDGEMTTPTGAAIITTLADSFGYDGTIIPEVSGYGAGKRERTGMPNVLRLTVGSTALGYEEDRAVLIETNIDDMNPEVFGYVSGRLFDAGAKDVYMIPMYMKKGRPGTLIGVLTDEAGLSTMMEILFAETTSIGIRINRITRRKLKREEKMVSTEFGPIRVKTVHWGTNERITPEYEDCARIARERGIPLSQVYTAVRNGRLV